MNLLRLSGIFVHFRTRGKRRRRLAGEGDGGARKDSCRLPSVGALMALAALPCLLASDAAAQQVTADEAVAMLDDGLRLFMQEESRTYDASILRGVRVDSTVTVPADLDLAGAVAGATGLELRTGPQPRFCDPNGLHPVWRVEDARTRLSLGLSLVARDSAVVWVTSSSGTALGSSWTRKVGLRRTGDRSWVATGLEEGGIHTSGQACRPGPPTGMSGDELFALMTTAARSSAGEAGGGSGSACVNDPFSGWLGALAAERDASFRQGGVFFAGCETDPDTGETRTPAGDAAARVLLHHIVFHDAEDVSVYARLATQPQMQFRQCRYALGGGTWRQVECRWVPAEWSYPGGG